MIATLKAFVARHWPVLRLRTILFGTLLFVAALPGISAIFLRVYENALVRRTEAELVAQSAALAASAAVDWPGRKGRIATQADPFLDAVDRGDNSYGMPTFRDHPTEIDLRSSPILPPRPPAKAAREPPDPAALSVADHLQPAFEETKRTTLSSIIMLDARGTVLTGPDRGRSLAFLPEVHSALGGKPMTVLRINENYGAHYPFEWLSRASNIRLHHTRPITVDGQAKAVVLVSRSPRALFRGIYEDRGKIILGVVAIFLLLIVLSAVLSRAIVRPIENLSRTTRALSSGRHVSPVRPSLQVVEIRDLFRDFEVMAASIDKRSRYLRDFASSVSHEFKTPLAAISGAIELLQDHAEDMPPTDRERFLANMAADAERLSRLVRRLMELAQADLRMDGVEEQTDIAPTLAAVADGLGGSGFAVRLDLPDALPALAIDADALEAVLTTLVENARQAGASKLSVSASRNANEVNLDLVDDGPGVPPADQARIFDPFFTSKREQGGTGLGLSIARSLLQAYRGSLELVPSEHGAHFRITVGAA
ncbi:sensor histidine kinase [Sphingobium subterraneum]|uniref:histidine kinase n=1 Tax=Sphingobium subterraneum TaxID=627688 RepID=A0A841J256_9SPHN|nr:HAMP domain-containing sensor histidine kinase [Sphingobium subterraneum]MBB6124907.1 signal transduction histidine kinase [Sphingobium subterraneum]